MYISWCFISVDGIGMQLDEEIIVRIVRWFDVSKVYASKSKVLQYAIIEVFAVVLLKI
jgi:hypothetical protein